MLDKSAPYRNNSVIVDKTFADQYNKKVGDRLTIHVGTTVGGGERVLSITIAGIVTDPSKIPHTQRLDR